ncbi:MAG: LysR family transcriptional regulator [Bdellovibrionaceae bacterium]|nr:LysR family transcriptional regulator [Bdellovibrio sp.]
MSRDLNVDQIKKLWILNLIIQTGSLKKAALQAKVSPSAISQTLTALEEAVGHPLLIRDRGSVRPTAEAQTILNVVRPAFEAFDRLRDLNHQPVPKISWLNFGTYESIAIDILPGLINSVRLKLPNARLGLRTARTSQLLTMVRKGELCSALIAEVDNLERFFIKEVFVDRLGLYVSPHHPIAQHGWDALSRCGLGSLAPSKEGMPRYFTKYLKQLEPVKPFLLCESFECLRSAAVAGTMVAVLPHRVAMRTDDLVELIPPKSFKHTGRHSLFLISQSNCDRDEIDFLAEETSRLLHY